MNDSIELFQVENNSKYAILFKVNFKKYSIISAIMEKRNFSTTAFHHSSIFTIIDNQNEKLEGKRKIFL